MAGGGDRLVWLGDGELICMQVRELGVAGEGGVAGRSCRARKGLAHVHAPGKALLRFVFVVFRGRNRVFPIVLRHIQPKTGQNCVAARCDSRGYPFHNYGAYRRLITVLVVDLFAGPPLSAPVNEKRLNVTRSRSDLDDIAPRLGSTATAPPVPCLWCSSTT